MFTPDTLQGKAGVVTGGSSGIGLAIAEMLHQHGAKITIVGRNPEKLADAAKAIGDDVATTAGDVRNAEDVARNLDDHLKAHGRLDFLINNAAGNFLCPLEHMSENAFHSVLKIVTMGTFLWSKAALPALKESGSGRIINIGTTYSWGHAALVGHSGAAKAAVLNMTRTMAVEWGPYGISTNLIAPGPIENTEGMRRLMPDKKAMEHMLSLIPSRRMGKGSDIAALAVFLASPLGAYINGAAIPVDGGASLGIPGLLPANFQLPEEALGK